MNSLMKIYNKAQENNWCMKVGCTTCYCGDVRQEVSKLDISELFRELDGLSKAEIKQLIEGGPSAVLDIAAVEIRYQHPELNIEDYPELLKFVYGSWDLSKKIYEIREEIKLVKDKIQSYHNKIENKEKQLIHLENKLKNEEMREIELYEEIIGE